MKKFRKLLALLAAGVLTVSAAIPVCAAQDTTGLADGTAYLNINNDAWGEFEAEWTNAEITGDGQYTVGMVAAEGQSLVQFNALEVVNGESYLGTGCVLTVDSITINGEEVELQGASYTCSADGAGVTTRVNIYNEWNTPDETATAGDDGHLDCRVAEGSVADATACLFSSDYCNASSGSGFLVESMEVTFTVSGFGTSAAAGEATATEAAELPAEGTTAYLSFADNAWAVQYWFDGNDYSPVVANNATVTGYGEYTVGLDFTGVDGGVAPDIVFFDVEVAGGESYFPTCLMNISSVKVNGEEVEVGKTYTCSDDGVATRVNLYNSWVDDSSIATNETARCEDGDLSTATATPVAADTITNIETIEVTFTLAEGTGETNTAEAETTVEAVDLNGTYNAYLGLQTPTYSFRNAFDDATYGRDTDYFWQITGWDGADAIVREGTFTDAVIAGNGTYTVSVSGMDLSGDFDSQDYFNLIFLSTDIPNTGEITISDMVLNVDGRDVSINPVLSPDSVNYVNMLIQNIWNEDVATIGYYSVPPTEMSITFTVSGFAYDNPDAVAVESAAEETTAAESTEAAAEETTEVEEESGSSVNVGLIVVIVIVVIAVIVAVVLATKKKK